MMGTNTREQKFVWWHPRGIYVEYMSVEVIPSVAFGDWSLQRIYGGVGRRCSIV